MDEIGFGLQISAAGIALVFGLLALLWGLLELIARLDRPAAQRAAAPAQRAAAAPAPDPQLYAAIALAVALHRDSRRGQAAPAMRSYWPGSLLYASRWVMAGRVRQNRSWQRGR